MQIVLARLLLDGEVLIERSTSAVRVPDAHHAGVATGHERLNSGIDRGRNAPGLVQHNEVAATDLAEALERTHRVRGRGHASER